MNQQTQKNFALTSSVNKQESVHSTEHQSSSQWIKSKLGIPNNVDLSNLFQIFSQFDTDNSGSVSIQQWRQAMKRFGHEASEQEVQELLRQNNIQPEQDLTVLEFIALISRKQQTMRGRQHNELSRAFRLFDKDLDGFITAKELKEGLERSGQTMRLQDLELLVSIGDNDGDNTINFNEFCHIMTLK